MELYNGIMTKNPIVNGFSASAYIFLVVSLLNWASEAASGPDTFGTPMAFISLFTFSAAMMGYIFFYQPIQLYLDGKKKVAASLFLQTLGVFGGITFLILTLVFLRVF